MRGRLCIVGLLGLSATLTAGDTRDEVFRFPNASALSVVVENDYGSVRAQPTIGTDVVVRATVAAASADRLSKVDFVARQVSGNRIFVKTYFNDYRGESVDISLELPAGVNLTVWGVNTGANVQGLSGVTRIHTLTGSILADGITGPTTLQTESGGIDLQVLVQPVRDIRVESITGPVRVALREGHDLQAWLRAGGKLSWNGEIELSPGHLSRQIGTRGPLLAAESVRGDVTIGFGTLPPSVPVMASTLPNDEAAAEATAPDPRQPAPTEPDSPPVLLDPGRPAAPETDAPTAPDPTGAETDPLPDSIPSFRVAVNWVHLNVNVRDRRSNLSVPNLRMEDFQVYEDSIEQRIQRLQPTDAPINVLLLLDISNSTKSYMGLIRRSAWGFARSTKPTDSVAVATFNTDVRLLCNFTNDRRRLAQTIDGIRSSGGTAIYDAMHRSVREYMSGIEGRKAIVVFSDGVDNQLTDDWSSGSDWTFPELFREIQEIDTTIYAIFLDTGEKVHGKNGKARVSRSALDDLERIMVGNRKAEDVCRDIRYQDYQVACRQLEAISEQTGGRIYAPRRAEDLQRVFPVIADDLRSQYTLTYSSSNVGRDGAWRDIQVRLRGHPEWVARTRRGYYASAGPKS